MHLESTSFHARTLNPYNSSLTAGGSSGGEAALLAMRGSVLGVGSDIGGSIRCPASFCEIFGFKPTSGVVPRKDALIGGSAAEITVPGCVGPMSRSLRDLDLFMSVMSASKPWLKDPKMIRVAWTGLGIEVKSFAPFRTAEAITNLRKAYWPGGGKRERDTMTKSGEPWMPLSAWIIEDAATNPVVDDMSLVGMRSAQEQFLQQFAQHWAEQDVDVVVCPAFPGPACRHETSWYWNYTGFWNYVDYPGVSLPTPFVAGPSGAETYRTDEPLSDACKHTRQLWEGNSFEGAPIGIQVVAPRYHDNELFQALDRLKTYLGVA